MNKIYIMFLLLCSIIIGLFSTGASGYKEGRNRSKEFNFTHSLHIKSMSMECVECHKNARESTSNKGNLLPKMETCGPCHDIKGDCNKCHKESKEKQPFFNPEREYNYSHKAHLDLDSTIICTSCHLGLEEVEYSFEAPKALPEMELCFGCHNDGMDSKDLEYVKIINTKSFVASKSCETCHTDQSNLKPKTHYVSDFRKKHGASVRSGLFINNCSACHAESFCQGCHSGSALLPQKDALSNATTDKSPKMENTDDANKMIVQNVHSLNYIMTHPIDARTKSSSCFTCHNEKTFCNECHSGEGENALRRKPKWHNQGGYTTFGRGSGGGIHARYAKREIETCMSCHDTRGGDPVCLMCHIDADGVKGTDPKTHAKDFDGGGEGGQFHHDSGAVCFNCHTDINAKNRIAGKGFCSYCHGGGRK